MFWKRNEPKIKEFIAKMNNFAEIFLTISFSDELSAITIVAATRGFHFYGVFDYYDYRKKKSKVKMFVNYGKS